MISKNLCANLTRLRKKQNMTTAQVAMIAGLDQVSYEKIELGFEEAPFETVSKLASFYNVDIADLTQENLKQRNDFDIDLSSRPVERVENYKNENQNVYDQNTNNSNQNLNYAGQRVAKQSQKSLAFNVVLLILGALLTIWFFVIPIATYSGRIMDFDVSGYACLYELFNSKSTQAIIMALTTLIVPIWILVNNTILLCSKKLKVSKYATVSNVFSIIGLVILLAVSIMLIVDFGAGLTLLYLAVVLAVIVFTIIDMIQKREKINLTNEEKEEYILKHKKTAKSFGIVSLILASIICAFTLVGYIVTAISRHDYALLISIPICLSYVVFVAIPKKTTTIFVFEYIFLLLLGVFALGYWHYLPCVILAVANLFELGFIIPQHIMTTKIKNYEIELNKQIKNN